MENYKITSGWLNGVQTAKFFNVSAMTISRWERDPDLNFPLPTRINHRNYRHVDQLNDWMKSRVVSRVA